MKKLSKALSVLVVLSMLATFTFGCGSSSNSVKETAKTGSSAAAGTTAAATEPALEKVPLVLFVAGDRPKQQDEVIANLNKVSEKDLNIELTVNYIPWGDYINQMKLKAAAGEEFDVYLSFFSEIAGSISRKQCIAVNDLLDKYGADLKEKIPQNLWDTLTVDGKIYGVPTVYAMSELARGIIDRKDLRVKYNIPEITDMASFENFLSTITKNEPDMIGYAGGRHTGNRI